MLFGLFKGKTYSLALIDAGELKVKAIKLVRQHTGLGLKESKAIVDDCPAVFIKGLSKSQAKSIQKEMIADYPGMDLKIEAE